MKEMHLCQASAVTLLCYCILFLFCHHLTVASVNGGYAPAPDFLGDVAINCGSRRNSVGFDGREWIAEAQGLEPQGKSTSSRIAKERSFSADPIPYMTARISTTQFSYTFQVNPGQKFVRLHFHPSSYRGFEKSQDSFTVEAGPFTLLKNFSASLTADALGVNYLIKEFCLNVEENEKLHITFSPYQSNKLRKTYAFVNGIEIISMPTGLYYTPAGNLGAPIVGQTNRFYCIDNSTALEMVQRLNIGGSSISPLEDFGMFRSWSDDASYLLTSKLQPGNHLVRGIKFTNTPAFTAPLKIYQTSWTTGKNGRADKMHDFTWKIPVDVGFAYLVRLHFCDFELEMTKGGQREFSVLINNQVAETKADVIKFSSGTGVPAYRDYVVIVKGGKKGSSFDLLVALQSSDESVVGIFRGLEIFKLSNPDNNLASPNHIHLKQVSASWKARIQNLLLAVGRKNAIATGMTILIISLNIIVFKLREIWVQICHEEKHTRSASREQPFHCFSLAEIISATRNFSDALVIGRGGFGKVYKGFICGGSEIVAVKRLESNSKQGAHEFWTEIETLSKIRHAHLVSLIGYCNEYQEMILVYEYMPNGTLADNLHKIGRNGKDVTPLTWEQRLRICIGAARGIDYLHTGIKYGVIHRDVKDSNILLDENLVAKVSDFGLSKLGKESESLSSVSTKVKGTWSYLDPDYLITHNLTRKTDVYAFGVVLLVVLCGKPAVDRRIPTKTKTLVSSFRECTTKGGIDDIIDPSLQGKISSESLSKFLTCIESCLHNQSKKRPTMAQVVASLECALEGQQIIPSSISDDAIYDGEPYEIENLQSPQFGQSTLSLILEESGTVKSLSEEVKPKRVVIHSRARDDTHIQRPSWGWPWKALRNRGKRMKEKDLVSGNGRVFSIADIRTATDNLNPDRVILNNEFVMVYAGFLETVNVAIYRFKTLVHDEWVVEFREEIENLSQIRHQNLAFWVGYCYHQNEVCIVYQNMANGILHNNLYDDRWVPLPWKDRLEICLGVAQGLDYLHCGTAKRKIHCDLRPANILLSGNLTPHISNIGLYVVGPMGYITNASAFIEPSWAEYLPPEVIHKGSELTEKSDVYSFGLVLLEVLCCRRPAMYDEYVFHKRCIEDWVKSGIRTRTLDEIIDSRLKGQIGERCLAEYLDIAFSCLVDLATERPSMSHVVQRLQFALNLQENAEAGKEDTEEGEGDKAFRFDHIYQEISKLASNPAPNASGSASTGISVIGHQTDEQNPSEFHYQFLDDWESSTDVFPR